MIIKQGALVYDKVSGRFVKHTPVNAAVLYQIAVFDIVLYDFLISPYCVHVRGLALRADL